MVIAFDLWNTLARSRHQRSRGYASDVYDGLGVTAQVAYPFVRDTLMTRETESYEEMVAAVIARFDLSVSDEARRAAVHRWRMENERVEWVPCARALLRSLRQRGRSLVLVTNITRPAWESIDARLEVSRRFDRVFLSCAHGMSKPDVHVWEAVESWYSGESPSSCVMIGDNEADDLLVPRGRGWRTMVVPAGVGCREVLRRSRAEL